MKPTKYNPGDIFGYWTLLNYHCKGSWFAECVCGKIKLVNISHLTSGRSKSCSCQTKGTHRMTDTPSYRSWAKAKCRCTNPKDDRYKDYGGRGITMCQRWRDSFQNFLEDMGPRPEGYSLERIDVNGDYCPDNCKWATPEEQYNNLRSQRDKGYPKSIKTMAKEYGLTYGTLQSRLYRGWPLDTALKTPMGGNFKTVPIEVRLANRVQRKTL